MTDIAVTLDLNPDLLSLLMEGFVKKEVEGEESHSQLVFSTMISQNESSPNHFIKEECVELDLPDNLQPPEVSRVSINQGLETKEIETEEDTDQSTPHILLSVPKNKEREDIGYIETPTHVVMEYLKTEFNGEDISLLSKEERIESKPQDSALAKKDSALEFDSIKATIQLGTSAQAKITPEEAPKFVEVVQTTLKEKPSQPVTTQHNGTLQEQETDEVGQPTFKQIDKPKEVMSKDLPILSLKEATHISKAENAEQDFQGDLINGLRHIDIEKAVHKIEIPQATPKPSSIHPAQLTQQVAVHVKEALDLGMDKISIQLNPPALGKIEVELRFNEEGRVAAIFNLDKSDTFELLQRNPQLLKEALSETGFESSTADFTFNLNGQENQSNEHPSPFSPNEFNSGKEVLEDVQYYASNGIKDSTRKVDIHA